MIWQFPPRCSIIHVETISKIIHNPTLYFLFFFSISTNSLIPLFSNYGLYASFPKQDSDTHVQHQTHFLFPFSTKRTFSSCCSHGRQKCFITGPIIFLPLSLRFDQFRSTSLQIIINQTYHATFFSLSLF
jgi:hypothetical protein